MKINTQLLEKVKAHILAEPELFDMSEFNPANSKCGTACCIAGHAINLCDDPVIARAPGIYGAEIAISVMLEGENGEGYFRVRNAGGRLFYVDEWPEPFRSEFLALNGNKGPTCWRPAPGNHQKAAEVAARRIDHFIATNGEE